MIAILSANVNVIFGGASAFLGIHRINYTHVTSMGMGKHKVGVMLIMMASDKRAILAIAICRILTRAQSRVDEYVLLKPNGSDFDHRWPIDLEGEIAYIEQAMPLQQFSTYHILRGPYCAHRTPKRFAYDSDFNHACLPLSSTATVLHQSHPPSS